MIAADLTTKVPLPLDAIAEICRRHGVERLDVFGSVLRDDFRPDSDIDFLVLFRRNANRPRLGEYEDLQDDLEALLGRKVDVVGRKGVEASRNYVRRRHILSNARPIYVEG